MLGEVWLSWYPKQDKPDELMRRPSIIVGETDDLVLAIKLTKEEKRKNDAFDTTVEDWEDAGLYMPSTARVSTVQNIPKSQLIHKLGSLNEGDESRVAEALDRYLLSKMKKANKEKK
ncbi:hypothetical protein BU230_09000 [Klebsiella pneumoniae]|nr:hypothetical protein BU230_09000 [Klebsiella pneumoniae]